MDLLIDEIGLLVRGSVAEKVKQRLLEFESFKDKGSDEWFSELCFCILTANSKARTALEIQKELGSEGFCKAGMDEVRDCIIRYRHRFHNNKSRFIIAAREHVDIKQKVVGLIRDEGVVEAREWLVRNIKGIGYKEASHFLRNVGYKDVAILDRHILNLMVEYGVIDEVITKRQIAGEN